MTFLMAAASTGTALNPLFFVAGGVALIVVSTLGPLSRMHERRQQLKDRATQAKTPPPGQDFPE